jgi:hypothetical protein
VKNAFKKRIFRSELILAGFVIFFLAFALTTCSSPTGRNYGGGDGGLDDLGPATGIYTGNYQGTVYQGSIIGTPSWLSFRLSDTTLGGRYLDFGSFTKIFPNITFGTNPGEHGIVHERAAPGLAWTDTGTWTYIYSNGSKIGVLKDLTSTLTPDDVFIFLGQEPANSTSSGLVVDLDPPNDTVGTDPPVDISSLPAAIQGDLGRLPPY